MKNLHSSVKEDDLKAVFAAAGVSDLPSVRLMSGKMRGQAFAEFSSKYIFICLGLHRNIYIPGGKVISFLNCLLSLFSLGIAEATSVLELVNGYVMQGKPVIISYGHKK